MTLDSAHQIAAATAATLRREFPELLVRDGGVGSASLDAGVLTLVCWLIDRIGTDERLARDGGARICDQLLRDGFPRRPLIRALGILRVDLAWMGALDPAAVSRVMTNLHGILTRRLVPDAPVASAGGDLVFVA